MVPFRILALGGGGTKGFMHIGALHELESRIGNLTSHFNRGIYGCSIGSIFATGIAFGMNTTQIERLSKKFLSMNSMFSDLNFESLKLTLNKKGVLEMNTFENKIIEAFLSEGIDLQNKYLSDSLIPLHIVSTNLTKGIPTIFKNKIPILSALKASCCIPFLFRPQVIGNSVYIDGGMLTSIVLKLVPKEDQSDTLSICLLHSNPEITPRNIETMTPMDFTYKLYKIQTLYEHHTYNHPNVVGLHHPCSSGITDGTDEQKEEMILAGRTIMNNFLTQYSR